MLVTHFWYIRGVNQQTLQHTGLTRDGLFLIENGKITTPIMNFRFNESPVRLLKNTKMVGPGNARARTGRRHDDRPRYRRDGFPADLDLRRDLIGEILTIGYN